MFAKLFQILAFIFLESLILSEGVNIVDEEHITELIEKIVADKTLELKIQVQKLKNVVENQQSRINNLEKEGRRNERVISHVKKLWADMYHELKSNSLTTPDEDLPDTVKDNIDLSANNTEDILIGKDRNASIDLEQKLATSRPNSNRRDKRVMKYRQRREPEVVAFTAYLSHRIDHMGVGHRIVYDEVITNEGAGYNVYTGIFTAPLTGLYLFTYSANSHYVRSMLELVVDGHNVVDIIIDPVSNRETMSSNTAIIRVTKGQSVGVQEYYISDGSIFSDNIGRYCTFSGVLLY